MARSYTLALVSTALFVTTLTGCNRDIPLEVTSEPLKTESTTTPTSSTSSTSHISSDLKAPATAPKAELNRATPALSCGLPTYPGSRPKPYGNMSVTTGGRTTTIEAFRTADSVLKVADYYLKETAKYGKVVDRQKIPMSQTTMTIPIELATGGKTYVEVTRSESDTETEIKLTYFSDKGQSLD